MIPTLALGLFVLAAGAHATPTIDKAAADHVEAVGEQTLAVLGETGLTEAVRESRLRTVLGEGFGIAEICSRIAGDAWQGAGPAERGAFCESFRTYLLGYLIEKLVSEDPEGLEIIGSEALAGGQVRVSTKVEREGMTVAKIVWVVRDAPEGPEIVDVVTNGVSLIGTYTDEFRSVVRQQGIEALTAALDRKAAMR